MTEIIVVYEMVPESTTIHRLFLEGDELDLARRCSGRWAGQSGNTETVEDDLERLWLLLEPMVGVPLLGGVPLPIGGATELILTGIIL